MMHSLRGTPIGWGDLAVAVASLALLIFGAIKLLRARRTDLAPLPEEDFEGYDARKARTDPHTTAWVSIGVGVFGVIRFLIT